MQYLSFVWNPPQGIDLGFFMIRFYSLMFVIAFGAGWFLTKKIYDREGISLEKLDKLFITTVIATLVGARLGHVIFYQTELLWEDPLSVLLPIQTVPEFRITGFAGLASHGAAIAIPIAMYYYSKKVVQKPILWVLDRIVLAVAFGGMFVRFGNFFNSEIIGKPSGTDYGVIFAQLGETFPRYPTQIYEAMGYLITAIVIYFLYWKTEKRKQEGYIFGVFLVLLWMVRLIVEFWKEDQDGERINYVLNTGQWLSVPFIILGLYLIVRASPSKKEKV